MADIDLSDLMRNTGLAPTQKQVYTDNIVKYAQAMRRSPPEADAWDWSKTRTDLRSPMIKDVNGSIVAGHHRFIAAELAGVAIPDGVVKISPIPTSRIART